MMMTDNMRLGPSLLVLLQAALLNAALYSAIGAALWYGLFRRRVALALPICVMAGLWSWLLQL